MIQVNITLAAEDDYLEILEQTYRNSTDAALKLDDKMNALIANLRQFKHFCPPARRFPKFRRCVVTKNVALVYEVGKNSITIISVFDVRMGNPFS